MKLIMNILRLSFCSLLAFLICSTSLAWREGNGGDAVITTKGLFLLDLVEAGIEAKNDTTVFLKSPFFKKNLDSLEKSIGQKLPLLHLESKLQQIYLQNPTLSLLLLQSIRSLSWNFVNFPLKDIQDEGPNLSIPRSDLVQAAFRVNQTVQIHQDTWDKLDSRNQAALLLHEVLYALMKPERDNHGFDMNSPRVRVLIGHFFSADFSTKPLHDHLNSEAPHLNFPVAVNPQLDPVLNTKNEVIIFNRQWYATIPTAAGGETFEQVPFSSSLVPHWIEYICQLAAKEQTDFKFGLQGEKISCQLEKVGSGSSEEFYLLSEYNWPATLSVLKVATPEDTTSGLENCSQDILSKMKWLSFQAIN